MIKSTFFIALSIMISFPAHASLLKSTCESLRLSSQQTMGIHPSDFTKEQKNAYLKFNKNFLSLIGATDEPDILGGFKGLMQNFNQFDHELKKYPALFLLPFLCPQKKQPNFSSETQIKTVQDAYKAWATSSFAEEISHANHFIYTAKIPDHIKSYYRGVSHLLGHGEVCNFTLAKKHLELSAKRLDSAHRSLDLISDLSPKTTCAREILFKRWLMQ
ncbi:exported hypothetical protein [Candidatus Terasakiella magnetica]|uniref:Uncharacterized protein n=1 Tax=Candidatus Terasakiella magnetica TaxID=1867952 RepID=A0A1C3RDS5_9PROT|nr:hypothetical protein [Candidatus Terasakiella magnetica]SCA55392.1 exported hypothetical protein [Candidatus Terasakiella magnetica]